MFYSDNFKHIHIHNPKTGGKSLMFTIVANKNNIGWKRNFGMHLTLPEIESKYKDFYDEIKNYYKTIVVRNPWSHAVSFYYHALSTNRFYRENFFSVKNFVKMNDKEKQNIDLSFESFVNNGYQKYIQERYHKETDSLKFDKIFKYENWEEIIEFFQKTYDTDMSKTFNHHSREKIQTVNSIEILTDYRKLYNTKTIDKIASLSKDIIEKYNYKFE
jgi:hypothetical protein